MTKFKGIFMSRKLDIDRFLPQTTTFSQTDQWINRPFSSLSMPHGRENGLVTSSTFSPSADHRSEQQQSKAGREESKNFDSEGESTPSPVMDLTTTVADVRNQRDDRYAPASQTSHAQPGEERPASKSPAPLASHTHSFRSHDANWDTRATCRVPGALPLTTDSTDEPSSVNSPSECSSMSMSNESPSPTSGQIRKRKRRPQPIPENCKDDAYWERRKRNNESAKRSREMRRMKEQQTTMRVIYLEQDNLRLKTEVDMLRSELEKVREILYSRSGNFH